MKTKLTLMWLVLIIALTPLGNTVYASGGNPSHGYKTSLRSTTNPSFVQPKIAFAGECMSMEQKVIQLIGQEAYEKLTAPKLVPSVGSFELVPFAWPRTSQRPGKFYSFDDRDFSVYSSPSTCAHEVNGLIRVKYGELGWEKSLCGFPITDELPTPDGIGRFNHFESCSIYWTPATGAHVVYGAILDHWASMGWERSFLGYPVSDELSTYTSDVDRGRISQFQNGYIVWYPDNRLGTATGAQAFPGKAITRLTLTELTSIPDPSRPSNQGTQKLDLNCSGHIGNNPIASRSRFIWLYKGETAYDIPIGDVQLADGGYMILDCILVAHHKKTSVSWGKFFLGLGEAVGAGLGGGFGCAAGGPVLSVFCSVAGSIPGTEEAINAVKKHGDKVVAVFRVMATKKPEGPVAAWMSLDDRGTAINVFTVNDTSVEFTGRGSGDYTIKLAVYQP